MSNKSLSQASTISCENSEDTFTLSISVVLYKTPLTQIKECLATLIVALRACENFIGPDRSVLVLVDNSPSRIIDDADYRLLEQEFSESGINLDIIYGHGNVGYGAAHNIGFAKCKQNDKSFHLFMNPDIKIDQNCIRSGIEFLAKNPSVSLVSPFCEDFVGEQQFLCKRFPSVLDLFLRSINSAWLKNFFHRRLSNYEMRGMHKRSEPSEVLIASGCFMLGRADAISIVGGFDHRYFLYFEDFDLSLRIAKQGRLMFVPSMRIKHDGGNASQKGLQHIAMFIRSAARFFNKYGWRWY